MHAIENINHALELGTAQSFVWFRGHSKEYDELTPSIFRQTTMRLESISSTIGRREDLSLEHSVIEEFQRRAPSLTTDLPKLDDNLSWLFYMQHYGLPTRLLDWSESILVALYFAVSNDIKEDGELWILSPQKLNELSAIIGLPTHNNKKIKTLAAEAVRNTSEKLAEDSELDLPEYPLAIQAPISFPRILNQHSAFTLHPAPKDGNLLHDILNEKYLVRYIIPSDQKNTLKFALARLGINHVALFPNLDSLSKTIMDEHSIAHQRLSVPS